jgi:hypothetical protein
MATIAFVPGPQYYVDLLLSVWLLLASIMQLIPAVIVASGIDLKSPPSMEEKNAALGRAMQKMADEMFVT